MEFGRARCRNSLKSISPKAKSGRNVFKRLYMLTLTSLFVYKSAILARKYCMDKTNENVHQYNTRNEKQLHVEKGLFSCMQIYNKLPNVIKETEALLTLNNRAKIVADG